MIVQIRPCFLVFLDVSWWLINPKHKPHIVGWSRFFAFFLGGGYLNAMIRSTIIVNGVAQNPMVDHQIWVCFAVLHVFLCWGVYSILQ